MITFVLFENCQLTFCLPNYWLPFYCTAFEQVNQHQIITKSVYICIVSEAEGKYLKILTHCNTGSLATGGYGTALGVIRALKELGHITMAYCTETRPYNQGSRLTAYELVYEQIPAKLICDSAVSALMSTEV